jgi:ribosomal protein L7/L12
MAKEEAVDDFIGQITSQYSEAIDLLTGKPINYERFAVEVAKSSPSLFVKIAKSIQFEDEAPIARKRDLYEQENERINRYLVDLMRSNKKVEAIKAYRSMTGTGLKEAKDYCDALQTVDQVERDSGVASW